MALVLNHWPDLSVESWWLRDLGRDNTQYRISIEHQESCPRLKDPFRVTTQNLTPRRWRRFSSVLRSLLPSQPPWSFCYVYSLDMPSSRPSGPTISPCLWLLFCPLASQPLPLSVRL